MYKKIIYISVISMLALSCATMQSRRAVRYNALYPSSLKTTYLYTEGVKAGLLDGDSSRAVSLFRQVISLDSAHAPSYFELASIYALSDAGRAIDYAGRAVAMDTANVWYKGQLGRLYVITAQYDKAFGIYSQLTRMEPYNPGNYHMLAALYDQLKQPFTAIALLDSAEYKLGRIEELSHLKRQLLIEVSLYDKAIAESRALVNDFPWNPENYRILASLYAHTGKDSLAQATYEQALAVDSTDLETIKSMNAWYRQKGRVAPFFATARKLVSSDAMPLKEKLAFVQEMVNNRAFYSDNFFQVRDLVSILLIKYPKDYDVIDLYGTVMISSSGLEQALDFYKGQLADPQAPVNLYNTVMDMESYLKRPDSVARYNAMALARFPDDASLYLRQGSTFSYLDRSEEAIASFKKALKYAGSDSVHSVMLGAIGDEYHKTGNSKASYKYYERALQKNPDNITVLNNMSYYLATDGPDGRDLERALTMAERVIELAPGNPTFLDTYGWVLFKLGRLPEAKKAVQQAISLDSSESVELYMHYGDILYELKEYFMASIYWEKALQKGYDREQVEQRLKKIEGK